MRATKWILASALIAVTAFPGIAQHRDSANLSLDFPVPQWPANGVVPPELQSHYVFVDPPKNEFVVAYPENLGSPNFEKDGPGQREVFRFKMQLDVDPKVLAGVTSANGKYKYVYTVFNGTNAKNSIDQWVLITPPLSQYPAMKQPSEWFGVFQPERKLPVVNPEWIKSVGAAVFSFQKPDGQIKPGSNRGGFEIESDLKPGFTVAYLRQTENLESVFQASGNIPTVVVKNATPPPPPRGAAPPPAGGGGFGGPQVPAGATEAWQPIKNDVDKLLRFEYNSKSVLTLGPKFDKDASDKTIASDFMQGISVLVKAGAVTADSAFVKGTLSDLDAYVKAGGSGPLKLSAQPKGDAETEIFNAMKASLRLN